MISESIKDVERLIKALETVIKGRNDTLKLVITGLVAGGHVLVEDYPGSGKTTLAKTLGRLIDCSNSPSLNKNIIAFRRIQFTPDLLPTDVLGVNIFDPKSSSFHFQHGPIFAHIILADEINRTGPKVQAAFLECMAERQVTIDNTTHQLDELFFVIGTQNPLDLAGTYPLPLVQLDRFLLKIPMKYVSADKELEILKDAENINTQSNKISSAITREQLLSARNSCQEINIHEAILKTIVDIVQATRTNPQLQFGASTRSAIMLKKCCLAWALVEGRDFVTPDDVKTLAPFVLKHRLKFNPGISNTDEVFAEMIKPHIESLIRKM